MVVTTCGNENSDDHHYDRESELKAFEESKAGVKGLVDAGISKVPRMFIHEADGDDDDFMRTSSSNAQLNTPVIDLNGVDDGDPVRRRAVVEMVRDASETWGFFTLLNHGIPGTVLEEMVDGIRRFNEQDDEVKKELYSRDLSRKVIYNSNFNLYKSKAANWRDTFYCVMSPHPLNPQDLPATCRDILMEYKERIMRLGLKLLELMSEALGLHPNHLKDMECGEGLLILCHYYPACPQPELTMGSPRHSDNDFFTILLQDQIGGLQVLHQDQWIDVPPVPGALLINIGDVLQLVTNKRFKSVEHRVLANRRGPRISVACFFSTPRLPSSKSYEPIKELLSQEIN